jgi:hypothetical protein
MKRLLFAAPLFAMLCACTSMEPAIADKPLEGYQLVDASKVDMTAYSKDYAQCAAIANQNAMDLTPKVTDVARTAANKVSFGVIGSAKAAEAERGSVLRKCLAGRGYALLR